MIFGYGVGLICLILVVLNFISVGIAIRRAKPRATPLPPLRMRRPSASSGRSAGSTISARRRWGRASGSTIRPMKSFSASLGRNDPVVPVVQQADRRASERAARLIMGDEKVSANPKAQQLRARLGRGAPRVDHPRRFERADAARLYPAAPRELAADRPASSVPCRKGRIRRTSGRSSRSPSSTPTRRAGNMRPMASAPASRKARTCFGGAIFSRPAAGSERLPPRSPRTPHRPRSCAVPASRSILSTAHSSSRSGGARFMMSGTGKSAGRACGARHFPAYYLPEILAGSATPVMVGAYAADLIGWNVPLTAVLVLLSLYCSEMILAFANKWHFSWRLPFLFLLRDLMLPVDLSRRLAHQRFRLARHRHDRARGRAAEHLNCLWRHALIGKSLFLKRERS